jgi:uncharacterized membrane protein YdbT with pleckstrin-like domain
MLESLQKPIRRLLKVPPEPDPPLGEPSSVRVFRAAPGFLRYRLLAWAWKQAVGIVGLLFGVKFFQSDLAEVAERPVYNLLPWTLIELIEYLVIGAFAVQILYSLALVMLDFRYRWYMITDRSLRIREGIWKVQERTMTFSNVQNVTIRQGPVQRLLGIADLRVQTAGGGGKAEGESEQGSGDHLHVGYFRGVANAGEIRDAVLTQLRRLRSSGLGDPEEPVSAEPVPDTDRSVLEAAVELLRETRALAGALRQR